MSVGERPLGVTILGVLGILLSALALLGGLALTVFGLSFVPGLGDLSTMFAFLGGIVSVIGVVIAFAGVVGLVLSWGLLARKYWAWLIWLICEVLTVIGSLFSALGAPLAAIPGLAVSAIIIWYLLQPHVRAWFKGQPAPAAAYPPPPPYP